MTEPSSTHNRRSAPGAQRVGRSADSVSFCNPLVTDGTRWCLYGSLLLFLPLLLRFPGCLEARTYPCCASCFTSIMFFFLFLSLVSLICRPSHDSSFFLISFEQASFNRDLQNTWVKENRSFLFPKKGCAIIKLC